MRSRASVLQVLHRKDGASRPGEQPAAGAGRKMPSARLRALARSQDCAAASQHAAPGTTNHNPTSARVTWQQDHVTQTEKPQAADHGRTSAEAKVAPVGPSLSPSESTVQADHAVEGKVVAAKEPFGDSDGTEQGVADTKAQGGPSGRNAHSQTAQEEPGAVSLLQRL